MSMVTTTHSETLRTIGTCSTVHRGTYTSANPRTTSGVHFTKLSQPLNTAKWVLHVPDDSNLQRESRAFVLFSEDHRDQQSGFYPSDLRVIVRKRDIKLSDEGREECLHLDDTAKRPVFSVPGGKQ